MFRNALWLIGAFVGAVVLALLIRNDHGNIAILWPPYRIELSNNLAMLLGVIGFFVLYALIRSAVHAMTMPRRVAAARQRRHEQRSTRALADAVMALYEGRYDRAEKSALAAAEHPDIRDAGRLIAARSAHRLGAQARRDTLVRDVIAAGGFSRGAALQSQVEFALEDRRVEQAIGMVERLRSEGNPSAVALQTALVAYRDAGQWEKVLETVRQLNRRNALPPAEVQHSRAQAYRALLAARDGDANGIRELWKSLQADERKSGDLAAPTVVALTRAGVQDEARRIALTILDSDYNAELIEAYGSLDSIPAKGRLEQLERWRVSYGEQPRLLEMLGRVCAAERLWGKAETYLLASLAAGDAVSARVALGQLLEATGRRDEAALQYQAGARLAMGERPLAPVAAAPTVRNREVTGRAFDPLRHAAPPATAALADTAADVPAVELDPAPAVAHSDALPASVAPLRSAASSDAASMERDPAPDATAVPPAQSADAASDRKQGPLAA